MRIPDAGGHVASAKYPEQENWLLPKIENIQGIKRIWVTDWIFETIEALKLVEQLFKKEGKISKKILSEFY